MEYASPVWHSSLTSEQSKTLEAVQWRACLIIVGGGSLHTAVTVLLSSWTAFILDVNSKPKQEAQPSPSDRATMCLVSSNLAKGHATVQKLLIRQVLTKLMVWSWRFSRRQCVMNNVHSTMTRVGCHCLRCHKQTDDGRTVYVTCIPTTFCGEIF